MNRMRSRLLRASAVVLLAAVLFFGLRPGSEEVAVVNAVRGPLEVTIDAAAVTRVQDRFVITAPITGHLDRMLHRAGDSIAVGAIVARITPVPLDPQTRLQAEARVAAAMAAAQEGQSRAEQARQMLEQAERSTARMRTVAREGAMSRDALERSELALESARRDQDAAVARVRALNAEVAAARAGLIGLADPRGGVASVVRSPAPGRVLQVPEPSERVVAAGTPLLVIGDPARIEIVIDVLSTDAVAVRPGQTVRIEDWGGNGALKATVRRVEPAGFTKISALGVEEQRVNVIGDLTGAAPGLGDGYRVQAQIITWSATHVLKVPSSALFRTQQEWQVFVVENGRARARHVTVGRRSAMETEIADGLQPGESVILFPSERITAGARVRAER